MKFETRIDEPLIPLDSDNMLQFEESILQINTPKIVLLDDSWN
jgi:hypothetical protein